MHKCLCMCVCIHLLLTIVIMNPSNLFCLSYPVQSVWGGARKRRGWLCSSVYIMKPGTVIHSLPQPPNLSSSPTHPSSLHTGRTHTTQPIPVSQMLCYFSCWHVCEAKFTMCFFFPACGRLLLQYKYCMYYLIKRWLLEYAIAMTVWMCNKNVFYYV